MNGTMHIIAQSQGSLLMKVGDHVRISKYKFICANIYTQIRLKKSL